MKVASTILARSKAVAIVLGHLGVSQKGLERYGSWYTSRDCSTVLAASPVTRFALNQSLRQTGEDILDQASKALEASPKSPLVIHLFSNGGCFLLYEIEKLIEEGKDTDPKIKLVAERLAKGYQFFDSCPCYIRLLWDTEHALDSFPNPSWSSFGRRVYTNMASASLTFWCAATLSMNRPQELWDQMRKSTLCTNQIYVYSTKDMASDASAVDRLVEERRRAGNTCETHRYDDSNHCRLDTDHSQDYQQLIETALARAIERAGNE